MKLVLHATLTILFTFTGFTQLAFAQVPQEELDQLLVETNMTMAELQDYLAFYELNLDNYTTIDELRADLGTPITDENLTELLQTYELTREQLDTLLAEFGETLEDYHFIEDLDISVSYYLTNDEELAEIDKMLADIGLTEEETDKLFNHLMALDELALEQEMDRIMTAIEPYLDIEDPAQLTEEEQQQLLGLWEEMLTAFHLKANFQLVDGTKTPISFAELAKLETLGGRSLLIELTDLEGNLLADMQISEDMLGSDFVVDAGENLAQVGEMAGELTNKLHDAKLPDTASPFGLNIVLGVILMGSGLVLYLYSRRVEKA